MMQKHTFIADVHVGKLAKTLRLLGFDTLYSSNATTAQLTAVAMEQNRILLSRYAGYQTAPNLQVFVIDSAQPLQQLQQLVQHFNLQKYLHPFTRCLVCNGLLTIVDKSSIQSELEPRTRQAFDVFWQCGSCRRIYWKGSHYERMLQLVEIVKSFGR